MDTILLNRIQGVRDRFLIEMSERNKKLEQLKKLNKERDETIANIDTRVKAINFVESVAAQERLAVKERVEKLITSCLHEVYDDTYSVEFEYGVKGSKTSVEIYIVRKCNDGMVVRRGIDGIGGGVADTVSLPLKLIVLINDNEFDKVLVTDEPGKHLDTTRIVKFAKFVQEISHKLGVQVIMSSHWSAMSDYCDTLHQVQLNDSCSVVTRER